MAARAYGSMITLPTIPSPLVQGTVVIVRASVSKGDPEPQVLIVDDDRQGKLREDRRVRRQKISITACEPVRG